jgi:excisionase family DNA binding protein
MSNSAGTATRILTISQAARAYSISRHTLWRWIRSGRLAAFRPFAAKKFLVKREDIEAIIESSRVGTRVAS